MDKNFEIFISFKATDNGVLTEDIAVATDLYHTLTAAGYSVFFSGETLPKGGSGDFSREIDQALDQAKLLIVVASKVEYINSRWVEYEWKTFNADILSNLKGEAQIVTFTSGVDTRTMPRILRYVQNFNFDNKNTLVTFVNSFFNKEEKTTSNNIKTDKAKSNKKNNKKIDQGIYNSAGSGEYEILKLRGRRSYTLDMKAINNVKGHLKNKKYNVLVLGCAYGFVAETRFGLDDDIEYVICVDKNEDVLAKAREVYANYPHMKFYNLDIQSNEYIDGVKNIIEELGIDGIDVVFASDIFRYLNKPQTALRNTRKILKNGGYLIVRGCDDSTKMAYPDKNNTIGEIVNASLNLQGMPNYFIGRQLPLLIRNSGFKVRDIYIDIQTTLNMTYEEKEEFFLATFGSRKNIAKQILEHDDSSEEIVDKLINAVGKLEEIFYDVNFWYSESNLIFISSKEK